ncbi:TPA: MarR family winged helix-turn-helix transcriptional regulator [Pseudomonas aeruginosa]
MLRYALREHEISVYGALTVHTLSRLGEGISQSDLAYALHIDAASLVRTVDELERSGWMYKTVGVDRRVRYLWLTESGRKLPREIGRVFLEVENHMLMGVAPVELSTVSRVLKRMMRRF